MHDHVPHGNLSQIRNMSWDISRSILYSYEQIDGDDNSLEQCTRMSPTLGFDVSNLLKEISYLLS